MSTAPPFVGLEMTSIADGQTHTITADEFERGVWLGQGRYRGRCGAVVVAAAMVTDPGPRCAACVVPRC